MSDLGKHWQIVLIAVGAIATWVGFTFLGMSLSYREQRDYVTNWGVALMVAGLVVLLVGSLAYMRRPNRND